jgi:hypothetical protein
MTPLARRIIESVLVNDGEEVTGFARQSGKTETITNGGAMVLLPRLARIYPDYLGMFGGRLLGGHVRPVAGQVETMFNRTVTALTTERAKTIMDDPRSTTSPPVVVAWSRPSGWPSLDRWSR